MKHAIVYSEEVSESLQSNGAIVALESTIIAHGMPFPQNLEVAKEIESIIRKEGATPATIVILNGIIHVGLSTEELTQFAQLKDVYKCSRMDMPFFISQKKNAATTVAATMIIAEMAGIKVFATGGIGGVHRDAENTFDISADLTEFTKTQVAVVSAGAKAILDLPKTLEYLETMGVSVVGYQTDVFPAFYTRSSGLTLSMRMDTTMEMAQFISVNNQLGQKGILIANPIPAEAELDKSAIETAIELAIAKAKEEGISGKTITPFLLKTLNEVTGGKSQLANQSLVVNNAKIAAKIAIDLRTIERLR